jgi:hypothetical protein
VALETSYELALIAAKNRSSYTPIEYLIVPGALIIADKMLHKKKSANAIKRIPSSDTTVGSRIHDMAQEVVEQITENIKIDKKFTIQIDESVDVSDEADLFVYIRYFDVKKGTIVDEILGCKQLPNIQREKIFLKSLKMS